MDTSASTGIQKGANLWRIQLHNIFSLYNLYQYIV